MRRTYGKRRKYRHGGRHNVRYAVKYKRKKHIDWGIAALFALAVALSAAAALLIWKYCSGELDPAWFY